MQECAFTVLTDLRQSTRFGRDYGTESVVIWSAPGEEKLAYVHDESLGGLGLYLDEVQGLEIGCQVDIVYAGQSLEGRVRHIKQQADGDYIVGFECHAIGESVARQAD